MQRSAIVSVADPSVAAFRRVAAERHIVERYNACGRYKVRRQVGAAARACAAAAPAACIFVRVAVDRDVPGVDEQPALVAIAIKGLDLGRRRCRWSLGSSGVDPVGRLIARRSVLKLKPAVMLMM